MILHLPPITILGRKHAHQLLLSGMMFCFKINKKGNKTLNSALVSLPQSLPPLVFVNIYLAGVPSLSGTKVMITLY